jgi:hypothetical protein
MSTYWEGVKARWEGMMASGPAEAPPPPQQAPPQEAAPPGGWEMIYRKFREIEGRDPYSPQELRDWWDRL